MMLESLFNSRRSLLGPMERISVVLFGLITVLSRSSFNAASPCDEKRPRRSYHQEQEQAESRGQQAESVELTLSEITAPDEDDVLAPALRCNCREVAAGKEQGESH